MTETEAEWSDQDRTDMLALARYEAGICDCGFHRSLTHDKANHFTFEDDKCPICAGLAQYLRMQADESEKALKALGDKPAPMAPRPGDGRRTSVRLMTPDEVEERRNARAGAPSRSSSPSRSSGGRSGPPERPGRTPHP